MPCELPIKHHVERDSGMFKLRVVSDLSEVDMLHGSSQQAMIEMAMERHRRELEYRMYQQVQARLPMYGSVANAYYGCPNPSMPFQPPADSYGSATRSTAELSFRQQLQEKVREWLSGIRLN